MKSSILEEVKATAVTEPLRVLIVEHSRPDVELIVAQLKRMGTRFDTTLVEDQQQFRQALRENDFGIVLSDYRLPNWTGLDALRELRACGKDTPFVVVTGTLGEEAAVECIKQGVSDFVLKENLPRLPTVIKRTLNEKALRDENDRAHEALRISETRNRELVEHSFYGIFHAAADGTFLDANPALLLILGCNQLEDLQALNLVRDVYPVPRAISSTRCRLPFAWIGARRGNGVEEARRWLPDRSPASSPPFRSRRSRHDGIHHRRRHRAARDGTAVAPSPKI